MQWPFLLLAKAFRICQPAPHQLLRNTRILYATCQPAGLQLLQDPHLQFTSWFLGSNLQAECLLGKLLCTALLEMPDSCEVQDPYITQKTR